MDEEQIHAVGEALRTKEHRQKAINILKNIEHFPDELVDTSIEKLVFAFEQEDNLYHQNEILKQLGKMAKTHPERVAEFIPSIACVLGEKIEHQSSSDIRSSALVTEGTDILNSIIEEVEGPLPVPISPTDVEQLFEYGETPQRKLGYRLLGRTATPNAVRILTADIGYEVKSVKNARTEAVNDATNIVEQSIGGGGKITPEEAYICLSELYDSTHADINQEILPKVQKILFERLDQDDSDNEEILQATGRLAKINRDFAQSLIEETVRKLTEGSANQDALWKVLQKIATWESTLVIEGSKELLINTVEADTSTPKQPFSVIATLAATKQRRLPANLVEVVVDGLYAYDKELALQAIKAVENIKFYPPPEQLIQLAKGDGDVPTAAKAAIRKITQDQKSKTSAYVRDLENKNKEVSLFARDSGELYLKQRTSSGLWSDVNVGTLRNQMVRETIAAINRRDDSPLVMPHYEPRDVILIAVAVILNSTSESRQVGIYSPGSRSHWGMKGEVRNELDKFGISDVPGRIADAAPIPELIPHAYVWDENVKNDSSGEASGRFVLCKKLDDLKHVSKLDVILQNLSSRIPEGTEKKIREAESFHPDAILINTYSYYAKNERDARPRYGPPHGLDTVSTLPSVNTIDEVLSERDFQWHYHLSEQAPYQTEKDSLSDSYETSVGTWTLGDDDVRALANASTLRIKYVESSDLSALFNQLFELSASLRGVDDHGSGGLIFSRQLFFERLPVPCKDFDEWIRERYYKGERFLPPMIEERIEDVKRKADTVESLEAVQPLNRANQLLKQIAKQLHSQNPMFEQLRKEITEARKNDERLAIFSGSPKHAQILRDSLKKHEVVTQSEFDRGSVTVVSPDDARSMGVHDRLIIPGALHHENSGFYVHPRVAETFVMTYDREWASMIERHANEFVSLLNDTVGELDYSPYAFPNVVGDLPVNNPETIETIKSENDSQVDSVVDTLNVTASSESDETERKLKVEIIADAMKSVSSQEYREESVRYERETRHYTIETTNGEVIDLTNHDRVLRHRKMSDREEYHWVSPCSLTGGDTFVVFPSEIKSVIWEEQIRAVYETDIDADETLERLGQWCKAIERIWTRVSDETEFEGVYSEGKVHAKIYETIVRSVPDFNRNRRTVRTWFDSVLEADAPMDMVEDPSLRIGPRSHEDIEAIGRAFEYDLLITDAEDIEASMKRLRTVNRQQGHKLYEKLRDQMNSTQSNRVSDAAKHYEVIQVDEQNEELRSE